MMADMHLRNLRQKMMIEKKLEEANRRLESSKLAVRAPFVEVGRMVCNELL